MAYRSVRPAGLAFAAVAFGLLAASSAFAQTFPLRFMGGSAAAFRDLPVAIPSYQISFYTSHQATASGGVLTKTRLTTSISNVPEATMRKLTDEAYADLVAKLTALNVPMANPAEVRAALQAGGIAAAPDNRDVKRIGPGVTIGADVKKGYVAYGATEAPLIQGLHSAPTGGTPGFGNMGAITTIAAANRIGGVARAQQVIFVAPSLIIDFAKSDASGGRDFLGREAANASSRLEFAVAQGAGVTVYTPSKDGRFGTPGGLTTTKASAVNTPFGTVAQGEGAVRALSVATVTNSMYIEQDAARGDAVVVDLPVWENLVRQAYKDFNDAIVAEVRKSRKI